MEFQNIAPAELNQRAAGDDSIALIDVRTPAEFEEVHVPFARNVPLDQINPAELKAGPGRTLYVICKSGARSLQACRKLLAASVNNVVNVEGGTQAWERDGLPVIRGRKTISIERQVRITAGVIALAGALLAWFVNPYFAAIPAFIGAGLVFSGITDTCGMALLLCRMPWNRRGTCAVPHPKGVQS